GASRHPRSDGKPERTEAWVAMANRPVPVHAPNGAPSPASGLVVKRHAVLDSLALSSSNRMPARSVIESGAVPVANLQQHKSQIARHRAAVQNVRHQAQ